MYIEVEVDGPQLLYRFGGMATGIGIGTVSQIGDEEK